MNILNRLFLWTAALPACLYSQELNDSTANDWSMDIELNEVVVVAKRTVLKQAPDRIIYLTKNDPFAMGLNAIQVIGRIPRVSVVNNIVSVVGKSSVRYIVDGHLLEMPGDAVALKLKNLDSSDIEKIELLTTPPAKYAASDNVAYICITTRNESIGTRGNMWGNGIIREDLSYMFGGNISHSTRKIELSADASWQDARGINDLDRTYSFDGYSRVSCRSNHFTNRLFGGNVLFKYKFNANLNAGIIANFSSTRFGSKLLDETVDNGVSYLSRNVSPAKPNNAITLTSFADWVIDAKGKTLSFTYNYFKRYNRSFSDVTTLASNENLSRLTNYGTNKYQIHSAKVDAVLPFPFLHMDAGAAYTGIRNNTALSARDYVNGDWVDDASQSNMFRYDEQTVAVYASVEKNFSDSFYGKLGLRYEHTNVEGVQHIGNMRNDKNYGYLFPSLTVSWNNPGAGRFSLSYSMGVIRPNFGDLNPFRYYTTTTDYFSGNSELDASASHNVEFNYSLNGIYAVLYNSYVHDAIGYVSRFDAAGNQYTQPENCLSTDKFGLYASYNHSLFTWWNLNLGGEVFYTYAKSEINDFNDSNDLGWSGKLEMNTSWMLNRQRSLIFNLRFSHYFPYRDRMVRYSSCSLIGCDLRYSLMGNRLNPTLSVSDPFGWNVMKSCAYYNDYMVHTRNDIHSHAVSVRVSWSFGREKVADVYCDTKERESYRSL